MVDNFLYKKLELSSIDSEILKDIQKKLNRLNLKVSRRFGRLSLQKKSEPLHPQKRSNLKLLDKNSRQQYYANLREKSEETRKKVHKYWKDQKLREQKQKQFLEHLEMLRSEEEAKQKLIDDKAKEAARLAYLENLQKIKDKNDQRRRNKSVQNFKHSEYLKSTPLFKKYEERYQNEIEMPIFEQRKAELASLRKLNDPIRRENLRSHIQWYEDIKLQQSQKKSHSASFSHFRSTLGQKLYNEDKQRPDEEHEKHKFRTELADKMKQYAENVKHEKKPIIDKEKQNEIRTRIEKFSSSKVLANPAINTQSKAPSSEEKSRSAWIPRKYPKNPLVPDKPPKRESKLVDYLAEMRKKREESAEEDTMAILNSVSGDIPSVKKLSKLKKVSERIEKEVRKQDLINESAKNIASKNQLKQREDINNMLLSTIKSKLGVFQGIENE